ncbi:unnamed protein product [Closterium sp. NIES-64]|nr:unnamed protein product [Closterium sp. NIES-64]
MRDRAGAYGRWAAGRTQARGSGGHAGAEQRGALARWAEGRAGALGSGACSRAGQRGALARWAPGRAGTVGSGARWHGGQQGALGSKARWAPLPFPAMSAAPKLGEVTPTSQDFPLYLDLGSGLTAKLDEHDYAVLVDHRLEFNARCLGFGLKYAWIRAAPANMRLWSIGLGRLRAAMGKEDHSCFATVFVADVAVIPLHSSVVVILYPGDLLRARGETIRTSVRHFDPQTVKQWHRDEAIRVLKFFRAAVLAELGRDGRH